MVVKKNLAKIESSNISETEKAMSTKFVMHGCYINPYLYKFFQLILFD